MPQDTTEPINVNACSRCALWLSVRCEVIDRRCIAAPPRLSIAACLSTLAIIEAAALFFQKCSLFATAHRSLLLPTRLVAVVCVALNNQLSHLHVVSQRHAVHFADFFHLA